MKSDQFSSVSRRQFIVSAGLTAAAFGLASSYLSAAPQTLVEKARQSGASAKISTQTLRGNVSALIGSGGNIGVLTGADGKLIIDSGYSGSQKQIADALASLSGEPTKHLINTHWHFDHTDGNEWMHSAGATIMAHENTKKHLSTATRVDDWNFTFPASPERAIPTEVFTADKTLHLNGATVALKYYGPAHTDGDISLYFAEADVFHTGDTWWNGYFPFIDYSTGGTLDGMIKAAESNIAMVTDKTIVIPGHGPIGGKKELTEYRDVIVTIRDRVSALKKQSKSLDEIVATKPAAAYDAKWGTGFINGDFFTKLVYKGVDPNKQT
jgi:glyoxylase-like metal-dependent hydrolase (beta-lactamase superfamily II)